MTDATTDAAPGEVADNGQPESNTCKKPRDWEKAVSCAYLRFMDWRRSQKEAATAAGVGERTLQRWERSPWWPEAQAEAMGRWCGGLASDACNTVSKAVEAGDVQTARWALERLMPIMAAPAQRLEHTGKGGRPIQTEGQVHFYLPDNGRDKPQGG